MSRNSRPRVTLTTAVGRGAIGLIQLDGVGVVDILSQLTGRRKWPTACMRLVEFSKIDSGLAVLLRDEPEAWAQIMPHGGPLVVQKLLDRLIELGASYQRDPPAAIMYPEAATDLEADMLAALAGAASPAAIDLLLAQSQLWPRVCDQQAEQSASNDGLGQATTFPSAEPPESILARSDMLDRLINPPAIAVVGQPNVGKSTLTNRMIGRSASLVADLPGTTRDWVAGLAEIGQVAVRWMDTPGLRHSGDLIEQRAINLARQVIESADVLIAMRDPNLDWPGDEQLGRQADLWVMNKIDEVTAADSDTAGWKAELPLTISAMNGRGLDVLEIMIVKTLGLEELRVPRLWAFCAKLREIVEKREVGLLRRYALARIY